MKKVVFMTVLSVLLSFTLTGQIAKKAEVEAVKNVIQSAVDATYNTGDIKIIQKHIHPGFNLLLNRNNNLIAIPLDQIIQRVKQSKINGEYPPDDLTSIKFLSLEVEGTAAIAKIDFFWGEKRTCVDFLSLYKFDEEWKIVCWTGYHYPENE
jgi:hypothetical protein